MAVPATPPASHPHERDPWRPILAEKRNTATGFSLVRPTRHCSIANFTPFFRPAHPAIPPHSLLSGLAESLAQHVLRYRVCLSETLSATAVEIVAAVRKQGLEGVIAKRRDSLYEPGRRSGAWVKMRINKGQELVIGGYVPTGKNFDSLIVGYYQRDDLIYVCARAQWFHPGAKDKSVRASPEARNQDLSLFEPAPTR